MDEGRKMVLTRLLHLQYLDGIWIEQDKYMLPLAPIISFQNPGAEKCQEGVWREFAIFSGLKKNRVPDMGEK